MKYIIVPAKGMDIRKYPKGHVYQGHGENIELYRSAVKIQNCGLFDCALHGHNGIDCAMKEGTPILATTGTIVDVKDTPTGYGKHVRILTDMDENGDMFELTYGHLKDITTALGMKVKDGQVIGTMGNSGFVISGGTSYWGNAPAGKGVHLHLTARNMTKNETHWKQTYPTGAVAYIKDYDNGTFGSVDPIPFLKVAVQLTIISLANQVVDLLTKLLTLKK